MFSAMAHALDEVKTRAAIVDYVKIWLLLLIQGHVLHFNGEIMLEATNVDHM
jgi:hypothetical protein